MNHRDVRKAVADRLLGQPGWEQHPEQDHHFRHLLAGVHVMIYGAEVSVTFGTHDKSSYDKAVGAKTTYFPSLAIASVLEVAEALVFRRNIQGAKIGKSQRLRTEDIALLLARQEPGISLDDVLAHPIWVSGIGGYARRPTAGGLYRSVLDMRVSGLLYPYTNEHYLRLTPEGQEEADKLAARLDVRCPART
jgi:hypothetical protein